MADFLLQLLIMSFQATVILGVVMLLRAIFSGLHIAKKYVSLLWLIPYIAMILPWSIKTPFSFWNVFYEQQTKIEQQVDSMPYRTEIIGEIPVATESVTTETAATEALPERHQPPSLSEDSGMNKAENGLSAIFMSLFEGLTLWEATMNMLFVVWVIGMCVFFLIGILSSLKLRKKLVCRLLLKDNIYVADDIKEPFVFGVVKPNIYLPYNLKTEDEVYVVEHEKTHILRKDPLKKIIAFCITGIHWFNPFAYVMFHMMTKDMEMTCDEETIQRIGVEQKKEYASSLLKLSTGKRNVLIPVAFGEGNVKSRITNILKYRKTLGIFTGIAVIAIVLVAVFFLTKPTDVYVPLAVCAIAPEDGVMSTPDEERTRDIVVSYQGEEYQFTKEYYNSFRVFLEDLEVRSIPLDKSRDEGRDAEIVIRFLNESSYCDYNFNSDGSTLWYDNYVKPSYTYEVKEPEIVIHFLTAQLAVLKDAKAEGVNADYGEEDGADKDGLDSESIDYSADIYCNVQYLQLIYADDNTLVFETKNFLYLYAWESGSIDYWRKSDMHKTEMGYGFNDKYSDMLIYAPEVEGLDTADIAEEDYTIFRSDRCIEIAENQFVYLESGSGMLVDLCAVIVDENGDVLADTDGNLAGYPIFATYRKESNGAILLQEELENKLE